MLLEVAKVPASTHNSQHEGHARNRATSLLGSHVDDNSIKETIAGGADLCFPARPLRTIVMRKIHVCGNGNGIVPYRGSISPHPLRLPDSNTAHRTRTKLRYIAEPRDLNGVRNHLVDDIWGRPGDPG
jgi:hypothetical protein